MINASLEILQPRRLAVISNTPHYLRDGKVVGWGPTVREIDYLASLFDSVVHIAPLYPGTAPDSATPYTSPRVELRSVRPSGAEKPVEKLRIFARWPGYFASIRRACRGADVVHVRCPDNISLLAVLLLPLMRGHRARWIKYAGNWRPATDDPLSYRFQRWWLRKGVHGAQVTVNGEWGREPGHIHSFVNPCLTEEELRDGARVAGEKRLQFPVRLLYVGGIEAAKGAARAVEIMAELRRRGVNATLDLVGDGPDRSALQRRANELGIQDRSAFHGWIPRQEISRFYHESHIILLPSDSEGWPKVLSEAMAYGVVPLASDVSSIPQILRQCGTGSALPKDDVQGFAQAVQEYVWNPTRWTEHSANGVRAAPMFGYEAYLARVRTLLKMEENDDLLPLAMARVESAPESTAKGSR